MWVFNVFLYLMFLSGSPNYQEFRDAGAACYVYISDHGEQPSEPPPVCFYEED